MYSFHPSFKAHRWTGANDYFCISSDSWLAMGGGGGGFAFQIDDELDAGESNPSDTFGSPRLSSNEFFRHARDCFSSRVVVASLFFCACSRCFFFFFCRARARLFFFACSRRFYVFLCV